MKKLIESMDRIEECGMAEGPMGMAPPAPEMDKGNPVTVNVSMNASGKEHVADLLDMMKNAGLGDAAPAADVLMSPRMDMERLSGIMGKPEHDHDDDKMNRPAIADLDGGEDESYAAEMDDIDTDEAYSAGDENAEGMVSNCCSAPVQDERDGTGRCSACGEGCEAVAEEVATEDMSGEDSYTIKVKGKDMDSQNELARLAGLPTNEVDDEVEEAGGDYENEPDEQYSDLSAVIPDGDDLHKQKKSHLATAGGDNPMSVESIKATLMAALQEKKLSEGEMPAGLKKHMEKKGKGKAPAKGKSKSGKMPMDAGKDGKKGTKDDKPAFLTKEGVATKDSFDEAGCKSEMKRLDASGCSKNEMLKKVGAKFGCGKDKFEELYASSCGSH